MSGVLQRAGLRTLIVWTHGISIRDEQLRQWAKHAAAMAVIDSLEA